MTTRDTADGVPLGTPVSPRNARTEDVELDLLLDAIFRIYGLDFRNYARASLRRRLWRRVTAEGRTSLSGLQEVLLHDPTAMDRLRVDLSVTVTGMFRDPPFFRAIREQIVPHLKTYPFVRIWVAGCASGEEVYSLAILLREEGLAGRTRIYATDVSDDVLTRARHGLVPVDRLPEYASNYLEGGGLEQLSAYVEVEGRDARLDPSLREGVVFARHNLATDSTFNEFHLIVCRNVLIYFDRTLQRRVHRLFDDSLVPLGTLALGSRESLVTSEIESRFEPVDPEVRIYRKTA